MKKEDIIRKFTSRKFWMAVVSFITLMIIYVTGDRSKAEQIASLIMAFGTVICYIIGEGMTDAANLKSEDEEK